MDLPSVVTDYLGDCIGEKSVVAYFFVGYDGLLKKKGGDLRLLGLDSLLTACSAIAQLPFLDGLLSLRTDREIVPFIQLVSGLYMDIHIKNDRKEDGQWIIFFNSTQKALQLQKMQQKRNMTAWCNEKNEADK